MPRDRAHEREWLERAAADPEFAPAVVARLERAEAEYGEDGFRERSLRELVGEVDEEALDIAGWAVLATQVDLAGVPVYAQARVHRLLMQAAEMAGMVSLLMRTAASCLPPPDDPV